MKRFILSMMLIQTVWSTKAQTPVLIKANLDGRELFSFDGKAYFTEQTNGFLNEKAWMSDGTAAGTYLLNNNVGSCKGFRKAGNLVYFVGYDSINFEEQLYKTDGTVAGTVLVKDINPSGPDAPTTGITFNNKLYFNANDAVLGQAFYVTDGTPQGTNIVTSFPNVLGTFVKGYDTINHKIIYISNDIMGQGGFKVHAYDGTTDVILNNFPLLATGNYVDPLNIPIYPHKLEVNGNIFYGYFFNGQVNLLKIDGTTLFQMGIPLNAASFVNTSNAVYFRDFNVATGVELYKADFNLNNISLVVDGNPSNGAGNTISSMTVYNDTLYYFYDNGINGFELWKSDGTANGTQLVKEIMPGNASSLPSGYFQHAPPMVEFCGKLYFNAKDSIYGEELWESDGTTAGTKIVADFAIGNADSYIRELMISNGRMYLFAMDAQLVSSLWMIEECYTPTAVESITQEPLLCSIFPNPSDGSFSIAIPNVNKQMSVEVYDMMGLLVSQWSNLTTLNAIDLTQDAKGVYMIKLQQGGTTLYSQKIIKN